MSAAARTNFRGVAVNPAALRPALFSAFLLSAGLSTAEAGTILWHWEGPVTGYSFNCPPGANCGLALESVVPLGTMVRVSVAIDPDRPPPNPGTPCYRGTVSTSLQVLGRTYTSTGFVWDEAHGFGPGVCVPGYDVIEVVAPSWGSGGPELADGWVPFVDFGFYFPGLWWAGDLTYIQPLAISSQFPRFYKPQQSIPQRFFANLQAAPADLQTAPEPTTWILFGTGLAAAAWRRRRS